VSVISEEGKVVEKRKTMNTQKQEIAVQEIWELFRETDRMLKELAKGLEKTHEQVGDLTDSWGKFIESMVEPAVIRLFAERYIALEVTTLRSKRHRDGRDVEIDILGVNREYVVAVEVKTTLRVDDVEDHVKRLEEFKTFFPEYRERKVVGAVAGMRLQEGVEKYAERQGLYVLAQSGETVQMLNDEAFEARVW